MTPGPAAATAVGERRSAPRFGVAGQLDGWIQQLEMPVAVLDIARGGIGIAAHLALEVGTLHDIRLTSRNGEVAEIHARVTNCRQIESPTGGSYFGIGLQVVGPDGPLQRLIDVLTGASTDRPK